MKSISWVHAVLITFCISFSGQAFAVLEFECPDDYAESPRKLDPGTTQSFDYSTSCKIRSTGCEADSGGDRWCDAAVDLDKNRIQLRSTIYLGGVNTVSRAWLAIQNYFYISGDSESERRVKATFSSIVDWKGSLDIGETGPGQSEASIRIVARLIDDSNQQVVAEQEIMEKSCALESVLPTACFKSPEGEQELNLSADLVVGRRYLFEIAAQCKSTLTGVGGGVLCLFRDDEQGGVLNAKRFVKRGDLKVVVARDFEQEIDDLKDTVEALLMEYSAHSHIYKTGPGTAHNKEDAETSLPENPDDE